jgi:hypothetical protein
MKYKVGLIKQDGYCGVEVFERKRNITKHGKIERSYTEVSDFYKDKKYKRGTILRKLGLWENVKRQHGRNYR